MEDRLRQRMRALASELALEEKARLGAAGTLVDIELLTAEIGDELARQMASQLLSLQSAEVSAKPVHSCPDCGRDCPAEPDPEPVILRGIRGEIEYPEPRCYCPHCRRAFFPGGGRSAASSP